MRKASDPRFSGDLRTAAVRNLPVTISYFKDGMDPDTDTPAVRTIEPYGEWVKTQAGNYLIKAMDRESGKPRSWRVDRVVSYTLHRRGRAALSRPLPPAPLPPVPAPHPLPENALSEAWGAWLEATYDPDTPPYDRLEEKDI